MGFDIEGYRKAAKEAGLSDDDIQKDIEEETKGLTPVGADASMENVKVGKDFMGIPEWLQPAAALGGAALLGGAAGGLGMKLKERMNKPEQPAAARVEPTFGIPDVEAAQPQNKFTPPQGDVTDVASRPVGEPKLQIGGPSALPTPEAVAPTPAPPTPNAPVPPPVETAPAPVQPKPLTELEQLRLEKAKFDLEAAKAKEARAAEIHANKLTSQVKRSEEKVQQGQGKAFNNQDNTILANAEKIKAEKALEAAGVKKAPKASVAPPVVAAPVAPISDKFVLPISSNPAETALSKEQMSARNWLSSQYGSPSKYFESVQNIHGGVPPSYTSAAGEKAIGKDAHQVIMDWRKANIEGPKVNLTHDMKKVMKGAGGMAVLMALPGFAEAAQNKDVGKMSDIFTDFFVLPFAQSREAGMPKAQEESTIAGKFKEASKLGSPYRSVPPPR